MTTASHLHETTPIQQAVSNVALMDQTRVRSAAVGLRLEHLEATDHDPDVRILPEETTAVSDEEFLHRVSSIDGEARALLAAKHICRILQQEESTHSGSVSILDSSEHSEELRRLLGVFDTAFPVPQR